MRIFRDCLTLGHVPIEGTDFIPKAGRREHIMAYGFKPISRTSFMLKALERIFDLEIRSGNSIRWIAVSVYKGRSTNTALHEVISAVDGGFIFGYRRRL